MSSTTTQLQKKERRYFYRLSSPIKRTEFLLFIKDSTKSIGHCTNLPYMQAGLRSSPSLDNVGYIFKEA